MDSTPASVRRRAGGWRASRPAPLVAVGLALAGLLAGARHAATPRQGAAGHALARVLVQGSAARSRAAERAVALVGGQLTRRLPIVDGVAATGVAEVADLAGRVVRVTNDRTGQSVACQNLSEEKDCTDSYGHGTFVAGTIAGDGADSSGHWKGAAPGARILSVKIAGRDGTASKPGDDPFVVTVGAIDDRGTKGLGDDVMPNFSSRGPTAADGIAKPDVVAPGGHVVSLRAPGSAIDAQFPNYVDGAYRKGSGTSMSTGIVSGIAALLLEANPAWTPDRLKYALQHTTRATASDDPTAVGTGLVDAYQAAFAAPAGTANQGLARSTGRGTLYASRGSVRMAVDDPESGILGVLLGPLLTAQLVLWDPLGWTRGNWDRDTWYSTGWATHGGSRSTGTARTGQAPTGATTTSGTGRAGPARPGTAPGSR